MKNVFLSGLLAGIILLIFSVLALYITIWCFPNIATQYYDPAFNTQSNRYMIFYIHPFIISLALSWFWERFKSVLVGSFLTRSIEFGLIYATIAIFPMIWMIYSAMNVSLEMVASWLVFGLLQAVIAGFVFEKINP